MNNHDQQAKRDELSRLRERVRELEREIQEPEKSDSPKSDSPKFYFAYYATTGFMLGLFGATTSLMFNIVGSLLVGNHPLRLIQVYLTFPLGERALLSEANSELMLAAGCCLYLGTGMVLGIPFQVILAKTVDAGTLLERMLVASGISIVLWVINFYGILFWLQPLLFGGDWIISFVPWWVAMLTHLIFGWTMALVYPWGRYAPYRRQSEMQ